VELVVARCDAEPPGDCDAVPDLVVIDDENETCDAFRLCRKIGAEESLAGAVRVLIVPAGSEERKRAGLELGVHDFLTRPLDRADIVATLRWTQRLRQSRQQVGADQLELRLAHDQLRYGFDQLLRLLVRLVDLRVPGAAARGERIAGMALMIAARTDVPVPMRHDLEIAARLHEVGRLIVDDESGRTGQFVLASRAVLRQVDGLRDVADLIGAIHENWDGTGFPNHLEQGQIPFRSRILRVLVDFSAALAADPRRPRLEVYETLAGHGGTRYDPMVLVHLRELVEAGITPALREDAVRVPITALEVGMILAEDLCTDAGLKLLARWTVLTPGALEIIRRRHQLEPILEGAVIATRAA